MMMIFFEKNFFLHKSRLLVVRERGRIARAGSSSKKCPDLKHFLSHSMFFTVSILSVACQSETSEAIILKAVASRPGSEPETDRM